MQNSFLSQHGLDAARLVETAAEGVWVIDAESRTAYVNARMAQMLGYTPEEMQGTPLFAFMDDDSRAVAVRNVERRHQGLSEQHDFRFCRKDGSTFWAIIATNPIFDEAGGYAGTLGMLSDITERKRAEDALRASENRYRALAEAVPHLVWAAAPDGSGRFYSPRWEEYTGGPIPEMRASGWTAFVPDEDRERVDRAWGEALRAGIAYEQECRLRSADGSDRWFLVRAQPSRDADGVLTQWVGTCTDIHAQKQAAATQRFLIALEDGMRQGVEADDVLWRVVSLLGEHLDASRCAIGEIDAAQDTITVLRDYCWGVPSWVGTQSRADWDEITRDGINVPLMQEGIQRATLCVQQADGPRRWTPEEVALVRAVADRAWLVVENARLRRAEREQHRRTDAILESIRDGFVSLDHQWRYTYVNQAAEDLLGWTRADMLGRTVWELFPEAAHSTFARAARRAVEGGVVVVMEVFSARHHGWFEEHIYPSPDGLSIFFRDITLEKRAEVERMEEAGRQRAFLRDTLASVTGGRLRLCGGLAQLPTRLTAFGEPVALRAATLADLRRTAAEAGQLGRLPEERIHDLVTAVGEAGMNAVVHAGGGIGQVCVSEGGQVQVWVEDHGAGIAMDTLPRATLEKGYTTAGSLGHGMKMMIETLDRLWLLTGPDGTTVVLEQDRCPSSPGWL